MRVDGLLVCASLTLVAAGAPLAAQVPQASTRWQPELRVDGFSGEPWAVHAGAGLGMRLTYNARLVVAGGIGESWSDATGGSGPGGRQQLSGRVDVMGRFILDPFREQARGPYAAAGLSQRLEAGLRPRTRITAVVGVEGQPHGGWVPSLEAGFGGGVRVGLVLRRALPDGR